MRFAKYTVSQPLPHGRGSILSRARQQAVFLAVALTTSVGCGGHEARPKTTAEAPTQTVQVVTAASTTRAGEVEMTGTVRAKVTTVLSARLMGYIQEIRAQVGDTVEAGQTVAVIDARETDTGYRQAEAASAEARSALPEANQAVAGAKAQMDLADSTYRRMKNLYDSKSMSEQEFDEVKARQLQARSQYEMALARREQVQARINQTQEAIATAGFQKTYREVKAPFAGVVLERKAEPGMLAAPGAPILVLEQAGNYRLEAAIDESLLPKIKVGQRVKVVLDALGRDFDSTVTEIVPALDPGSRSFTAKINLPAVAGLRSGVFGRARFALGQREAIALPRAAVVADGQVQRVLVVENGRAVGRLITTGASEGPTVEVLSGLRAGEVVVSPAPLGLRDGTRVEVRP